VLTVERVKKRRRNRGSKEIATKEKRMIKW
jgi:hypothetical protein